jgi:transcriptional regulator with XRE-family HTH domain
MKKINIGKRIKFAREYRDMSKSELAKNIGVLYQDVVRYEKTSREPHPTTLKKIADALDININYFLDEYESDNEDGNLPIDPYLPKSESNYGELLKAKKDAIKNRILAIEDTSTLRNICNMMADHLEDNSINDIQSYVDLLSNPPGKTKIIYKKKVK